MKGKRIEIIPNERYGKLIILAEAEKAKDGARRVLCRCDCGTEFVTRLKSVRIGNTKSCGCLRFSTAPKKEKKQRKRSRLYGVWTTMKGRCNNPNHTEYHRYGAKGIKVCEEWNSSFKTFEKWAYENGYDENAPRGKCTIDRIDSCGNYEPSNCRWVDFKIQSNNTNRNHLITYNGETHTMSEWSDITGISYYVIRSRVTRKESLQDIFFKGNLKIEKERRAKLCTG